MGANNLTFSGNLTTFKGLDATSSNFGLKVQDNVGSELFNVRNDGKITINTTVAANRGIFQIKGDADASIATFFTSTGGRAFDFTFSGDAGILRLRDAGGNIDVELSTTGESLIANGVLIGDGAVSFPLKVISRSNNAGIRILDNTGTKQVMQLGGLNEDGLLRILSSEVEKIHISANGASFFDGGDVGIGFITAPSAQLHIKGDMIVDSIFSIPTKLRTLGVGVTTFVVASNKMKITGDGSANTIGTITGGVNGMTLTITFVDALITLTDNNTSTTNTINLSAAFTSTANDILILEFDGVSWREASRSIN